MRHLLLHKRPVSLVRKIDLIRNSVDLEPNCATAEIIMFLGYDFVWREVSPSCPNAGWCQSALVEAGGLPAVV